MLVGKRPRKPQPVAEVGGEYPFISPGRLEPDDEVPPSSRERKAWLKCHSEEPWHGEILGQKHHPWHGKLIPGILRCAGSLSILSHPAQGVRGGEP